MGLLENRLVTCPFYFAVLFVAVICTAASAEDRCKDESFCKAYCSSTNPDTVSARCGRDMASCICVTPDNYAVKVRFIEPRNPVPPTVSTTPRPTFNGVKYVNSQSLPNTQYNNYNGNGNSIAGGQTQSHQQQNPAPAGPILLTCDGSDDSTRMCHFFCTVEIRAWYGLCNTTSTACSCFGIPLSAVQQEPITAIFHSTAPATPAPRTTTQKPYTPPRPDYQQFYPQHQYLQQQPQVQQQQQQQWTPIPSSSLHSTMYNNNQFYPASSPTTLNAVASQSNAAHEHSPVRSTASLFGPNGQPISPSILTPSDHNVEATLKGSSVPTAAHIPSDVPSTTDADVGTTIQENDDDLEPTTAKTTRKRRSINDTPVKDSSKRKNVVTAVKDSPREDDSCSKYKCAISCKRNNYVAPDCEPRCIDGQCWCECFPRL